MRHKRDMPRKKTRAELLADAKKIAENARYAHSRTNWKDCPPEVRAREANKATTLSPAPDMDYTLRKAFREFDLDPTNPWHWKHLAFLLAYLHFRTDLKQEVSRFLRGIGFHRTSTASEFLEWYRDLLQESAAGLA
jgi:hypothetical protein